MKRNLAKIFAVLALLLNMHVQAADTSSGTSAPKMLMYIQPIEYTHPIMLWHPYRGYWFSPGPIVEAEAMARLTQAYGDVSLCEGNQSGRTLVWLQPRMFYNPQVQLFYGKVTANVYTGMGKFVSSYEGEAKLHGFLDIKADDWIAQTFALAIDGMVAKMQADTALQSLLNDAGAVSAGDITPCSMVTLLPTPKIRVMSF